MLTMWQKVVTEKKRYEPKETGVNLLWTTGRVMERLAIPLNGIKTPMPGPETAPVDGEAYRRYPT